MLIVDLNTLQTVDTLYLAQQIILHGADTADLHDIMRVDRTFRDLLTGLNDLSFRHFDPGSVRNKVCLLSFLCSDFLVRVRDHDFAFLLLVFEDLDLTGDLGDNCKTLRLTGLKKLLDTGKTLCDIAAGNTAGVECTHRKLCAGLADRLGCDDTDGFTDLYRLAGRHVGTIALDADPELAAACEDRTDLDAFDRLTVRTNAELHHSLRPARVDHMVPLDENVAILIIDRLCRESSGDTILQ